MLYFQCGRVVQQSHLAVGSRMDSAVAYDSVNIGFATPLITQSGPGIGYDDMNIGYEPAPISVSGIPIPYDYVNLRVGQESVAGIYFHENIGLVTPVFEDSVRFGAYFYQNIGYENANIDEVTKVSGYFYQNIQSRPAGSEEDVTPTMN